MDGVNQNQNYVCCFCGKTIEDEVFIVLDVTATDSLDERQGLYCHKSCLSEVLHADIPLHPSLLD